VREREIEREREREREKGERRCVRERERCLWNLSVDGSGGGCERERVNVCKREGV